MVSAEISGFAGAAVYKPFWTTKYLAAPSRLSTCLDATVGRASSAGKAAVNAEPTASKTAAHAATAAFFAAVVLLLLEL
jgi:hypothetical protein